MAEGNIDIDFEKIEVPYEFGNPMSRVTSQEIRHDDEDRTPFIPEMVAEAPFPDSYHPRKRRRKARRHRPDVIEIYYFA